MKKTVDHLIIFSCFALGATLAHADTDAHHGEMHGKMHGKMFNAIDANVDGAITKEEFDTYHAKKFKEMDVNGDDKITFEDMNSKSRKADINRDNYYKVGKLR